MLTFDYAFLFFPGFTKCKRADKMVTPEMKQPSHVTFFFYSSITVLEQFHLTWKLDFQSRD